MRLLKISLKLDKEKVLHAVINTEKQNLSLVCLKIDKISGSYQWRNHVEDVLIPALESFSDSTRLLALGMFINHLDIFLRLVCPFSSNFGPFGHFKNHFLLFWDHFHKYFFPILNLARFLLIVFSHKNRAKIKFRTIFFIKVTQKKLIFYDFRPILTIFLQFAVHTVYE